MNKSTIGLLVFGVLIVVLSAAMLLFGNREVGDEHYIVGIVNPSKGMKDATRGFVDGMVERGYRDGENVTFLKWEEREGIKAAIDGMIDKGVDLIYTVTTPPTVAAKKATANSRIPIVFTMYDPVKSEVIESLARPGGNLTGVQVAGSIKRGLNWLLTVVPSAKTIFVPVRFDTMAAKQSLNEMKVQVQKAGLQLVIAEVNDTDELRDALDGIQADVDAIFMPHSILLTANAGMLLEVATNKRIPVLAAHRKKEATLSFGHNEYNTGRQASRMAHAMLRGESPENIPSEMAEFYVTINLQHAKAVGIDVTNDVLLLADEIVR